MGLDQRFGVSINRLWQAQKLGLPPAEKRWAKYNASFIVEEHTPASFLEQVASGCSFTAVLSGCQGPCCGSWCTSTEHKTVPGHCGRPYGYRRNQHFQSALFIALDFDTGDERSDLEYLLEQSLIVRNGSFLYTTLSHTPAHHKC